MEKASVFDGGEGKRELAAQQAGAQTELSQYSLGLLALLFDKSCRNLSRGHFQRYCRKPPLPPIVRPPCTAFSSTADCDPTTTTLLNAHSTRQLVCVFPHILRGHCCILHFSRVPLPFSFLIWEKREGEFHSNNKKFARIVRKESSIDSRFLLLLLLLYFIKRKGKKGKKGRGEEKMFSPHTWREGEKVKGTVERRGEKEERKSAREKSQLEVIDLSN